MALVHRCPKCSRYFDPPLDAASECPGCGIWFHKWNAPMPAAAAMALDVDEAPGRDEASPDVLTWYGRAAVLALVAVWGVFIAAMDYRTGEMGGSFMHNIVLPIHEAGHVFFRLLGEWMMMAGGSIFQVALPLAIGAAFLVKQRDGFGAAMCLWWAGASLVDLSPYIYDALDPQLVLLGGHTGDDGPHDWIYILGSFHAIRRAHGLGALAHHLGVLVMMAGVGWGGWWLARKAPWKK